MVTFRGTTYCKATDCKKFNSCDRAFNAEVIEAGTKWWGDINFPASTYSKPKNMKCYETTTKEKE